MATVGGVGVAWALLAAMVIVAAAPWSPVTVIVPCVLPPATTVGGFKDRVSEMGGEGFVDVPPHEGKVRAVPAMTASAMV